MGEVEEGKRWSVLVGAQRLQSRARLFASWGWDAGKQVRDMADGDRHVIQSSSAITV